MSAFANQLSTLIEAYGTNTAFAQATGIPQPSISRLANAKNPPDQATIEKLCEVLPEAESNKLLLAWLYDLVPKKYRKNIKIEPRKNVTRDTEYIDIITHLTPSCRKAIKVLASMALEDPEFGEYLKKSASLYRPEKMQQE